MKFRSSLRLCLGVFMLCLSAIVHPLIASAQQFTSDGAFALNLTWLPPEANATVNTDAQFSLTIFPSSSDNYPFNYPAIERVIIQAEVRFNGSVLYVLYPLSYFPLNVDIPEQANLVTRLDFQSFVPTAAGYYEVIVRGSLNDVTFNDQIYTLLVEDPSSGSIQGALPTTLPPVAQFELPTNLQVQLDPSMLAVQDTTTPTYSPCPENPFFQCTENFSFSASFDSDSGTAYPFERARIIVTILLRNPDVYAFDNQGGQGQLRWSVVFNDGAGDAQQLPLTARSTFVIPSRFSAASTVELPAFIPTADCCYELFVTGVLDNDAVNLMLSLPTESAQTVMFPQSRAVQMENLRAQIDAMQARIAALETQLGISPPNP